MTAACGHLALPDARRVCAHLLVEEPPSHVRWLTGSGVNYDVLCEECAEAGPGAADLLVVCEGCAERAAPDDLDMLPWRGEPEVRRRDVPVAGRRSVVSCPVRPANDHCVVAVPDGWLVLTAAGLVAVAPDGAAAPPVRVALATHVGEPWNGQHAAPALHVSADGRAAAVGTDYGAHGVVVSLPSGTVVRRLDRGSYHTDKTPFPIAFARTEGGEILVAATAWNQLGVFDPYTGGELAAETEPPPFFHGRLTANPARDWLLDDCWVWGPAGMPRAIDTAALLAADPTRRAPLAQRWYAWDQPVAWLDDDTVAISRIGPDDQAMIDGVTCYDVVSGRITAMFAGPAGRLWGHGGLLYAIGPDGLEIWDPVDGARTGAVEGFRPVAHDPRTGTFAQLGGGFLETWTPAGD